VNDKELREWQEYLAAETAKAQAAERERRGYAHQFKVGDGATTHIGSDAQAWTVVKVSPSGKTITIQGDNATLDPDWKPDFLPGGFVGHVANNHSQTYTYERNPNGPTRTARLTKRGWSSNGLPVTKGRRYFHDYNF
jgi:hypothetical protein